MTAGKFLVLVGIAGLAVPPEGAHASPREFLGDGPRHGAAHTSCAVRAHNLPLKTGDYPSPDHRFVARVTTEGPAEVAAVTIERADRRARGTTNQHIYGIESFMWLPGHPHNFVASTENAYADRAELFLWSGPRRLRRFHPFRPRFGPNWGEVYIIRGSSADGKVLCYSHAAAWNLDKHRNRVWVRQLSVERRLRLR